MQNVYTTIMNLQSGIYFRNAAFSYALDRQTDRQTDTLSLVVKKIKESKKDFAVKLNPYYYTYLL